MALILEMDEGDFVLIGREMRVTCLKRGDSFRLSIEAPDSVQISRGAIGMERHLVKQMRRERALVPHAFEHGATGCKQCGQGRHHLAHRGGVA